MADLVDQTRKVFKIVSKVMQASKGNVIPSLDEITAILNGIDSTEDAKDLSLVLPDALHQDLEVVFNTPLQTIYSFFLANVFELLPNLSIDNALLGNPNNANFLSLVEKLSDTHASNLSEILDRFLIYAKENNKELSDFDIKLVINYLRLLQDIHLKLNEICVQDLHAREHAKERYASDFLLALSKKYGNTLNICDAQNAIVSTGLEFRGTKPTIYPYGALITITDILAIDRRRLIAWFLSNKIADYYHYTHEQNRLIHQDFHYIHIAETNIAVDNFTKFCQDTLLSGRWPKLDANTINSWADELSNMIDLYDNLCGQLNMPAENGKVRVLLVGDSVSAGWGIDNPNHRWVSLLGQALNANNLPVEIANFSIPCAQTEQGVTTIATNLAAFMPDIIIGTQGGNDANVGKSTYKIERNITQVVANCVRHLKSRFDEENVARRIIWGVGIPATFTTVSVMGRASFADMLEKISNEQGINIIKLPKELLNRKNILPDRLHFKLEAHYDIARLAFQTVAPIIRDIVEKKDTSYELSESADFSIKSTKQLVFTQFIDQYLDSLQDSTNIKEKP